MGGVPQWLRIVFVRLRWKSGFGASRGGFRSAWNHDYPRAEQNLSLILRELTSLDIRADGSLDAIVHPMSHIRPSYDGIFEDNDPSNSRTTIRRSA